MIIQLYTISYFTFKQHESAIILDGGKYSEIFAEYKYFKIDWREFLKCHDEIEISRIYYKMPGSFEMIQISISSL